MNKQDEMQKIHKQHGVGEMANSIKRYLYLIPLIGVLCTKNKIMTISEEWTYFIYQWICSLLIPFFICMILMYFNVCCYQTN